MELKEQKFDDMLTFHQRMRNRFARTFLFATHVCHLIVFVELSVTFDVSMLAIFKSLRIIRYCYYDFGVLQLFIIFFFFC